MCRRLTVKWVGQVGTKSHVLAAESRGSGKW